MKVEIEVSGHCNNCRMMKELKTKEGENIFACLAFNRILDHHKTSGFEKAVRTVVGEDETIIYSCFECAAFAEKPAEAEKETDSGETEDTEEK